MKADVVVLNATELRPGSKYLLVIDDRAVTDADAYDLVNHLHHIGIPNAVLMTVRGDPAKAVQVIEQKESE